MGAFLELEIQNYSGTNCGVQPITGETLILPPGTHTLEVPWGQVVIVGGTNSIAIDPAESVSGLWNHRALVQVHSSGPQWTGQGWTVADGVQHGVSWGFVWLAAGIGLALLRYLGSRGWLSE